jgi:MoaA/NifB/PqqE/SkfB family radical SAM enzyme
MMKVERPPHVETRRAKAIVDADGRSFFGRRTLHAVSFQLRQARVVAKAMKSRHHPIVAHIVPIRRCNLACTYCNEFDDLSKPVPLVTMLRRIDRLAELGTTVITISGGEPLLHPELDDIIRQIRLRGSIATVITNGYLLTPERIQRLNRAGLDHLQISIDNVQPDDVSVKSLQVLDQKLQWLAEHAAFQVNINSVIGTSEHPEDAAAVARRARELEFATTVGIVHDGHGQLRPLGEAELRVYQEITHASGQSFSTFAYYNQFQKNLIEGKPNHWSCRAGSRYLYICEDGLVHYCSQQRGSPGIPLEKYSSEDLAREYQSVKGCAPMCTISCVHQVSMIDQFREQPKESLGRFFPARSGEDQAHDRPAIIRALTWMFLPPEKSKTRRKITQGFTRAALWCLKVR